MTSIEKTIVDRNEAELARAGKRIKFLTIALIVVLILTLGISIYNDGFSDGLRIFSWFALIEIALYLIVEVVFFTFYIPQAMGKKHLNKKFEKLISCDPDLARKYEEDFVAAERIDVHSDFYPLWLGKENLFLSSLTEMIVIPYDTIEDISVGEKKRLFPGPYNFNGRKIMYILVSLKGKGSHKIQVGYLESVDTARDIADKIKNSAFAGK